MMLGPNIIGTVSNSNASSVFDAVGSYSGAFSVGSANKSSYQTSGGGAGTLDFKASKSSSIFGASSTVQPPALTALILIKS